MAMQATAFVSSVAITEAGKAFQEAVQGSSEMFATVMGYFKEREITRREITREQEITNRIIDQERAQTQRFQIWSDTVIAQAEAKTDELRIQAEIVLAKLEDKRAQRASKIDVINGFLEIYSQWHKSLMELLKMRADKMSLSERQKLDRDIHVAMQRAREMELSITTITASL